MFKKKNKIKKMILSKINKFKVNLFFQHISQIFQYYFDFLLIKIDILI